jgi:hypothetical protein
MDCPCPEVTRLRDALAAADELLRTLGAKRAPDTIIITTWDELIAAVERRETEGRCARRS